MTTVASSTPDIHALAQDVADALNALHRRPDAAVPFRVHERANDDDPTPSYAELTDGALFLSLRIGTYGSERGRIVVRARPAPPAQDQGGTAFGHITVSGDSTPERIARAIISRLLPNACHALATVRERQAQDDRYRAQAAAIAAAIGATENTGRWMPYGPQDPFRPVLALTTDGNGPRVRATITVSTVSFEVDYVDPATATQIAALLAQVLR